MRRLLTSLPAMVTLILLIGVTTIAISRARTSDARMADFPEIGQDHDVIVELRFEPEAFHMAELQQAGRIVSVEGTYVHLRAVAPDDLRRLSWRPWIQTFAAVPDTDKS